MADARPVPPPFPSPTVIDPALGGPLRVSPPGRGAAVVVATDELMAHTERLGRLHDSLAAAAVALDRTDTSAIGALAAASPGAGAWPARRAAAHLDAARAAVRAAAGLAARAAADLRQAIARYTEAEAAQRERALHIGAMLGALWGAPMRTLLIAVLPGLFLARAAGVDVRSLPLADLRRWFIENPRIITDPAFVEGVRVAVMSADDLAGAAFGLPPSVAERLAAVYGFTGVEAGAALTLAAGRQFGMFRESPVSLERVATTQIGTGPAGSVERLSRVPEGDQVRIERYDAPGEPSRFVVYVGPTETFSPISADEPWDLTSNLAGVAGLDAGSLRATRLAMEDAGIRASDEVQFVGFSQGGLIATRLAASGDWNATGLETYGAPAGAIALPSGLDGMAIRNSDDFVPALAGPQLDHNLLQVERRAFAPGVEIPAIEPAPAHQREAYIATATVVDAAQSEAVRGQIAAMDAFTAHHVDRPGSSVTVMSYHATRGAPKSMAPTSSGSSIP